MVDDRPRRRRRSFVARLLSPFTATWRFLMINTPLGMLFRRRPARHARRPLGRRLLRPFVATWRLSAWMGRMFVVRPGAAVGSFLGRWLRTRAALNLWQGLPAVAVGTIAVVIVWMGWQTRDFDLVLRYEGAAWEALRNEELDAADVYFQKLAYLDDKDPRIQYGIALTAKAQGEDERAMRLMKRIAPDNGDGYPAAHFWIATQMVEGKTSHTPAELNLLHHHLQQVISTQQDTPQTHAMLVEAHAVLGQLFVAAGRADLAAEHLAHVVEDRPAMRLRLARLYRGLGKPDLANFQAETATKHYQRRIQESPDDAEARLYWAEAQAQLGNWSDAAKMLVDGYARTRDEIYRLPLSRLFIARSDELRRAGQGTIDHHVELLQQALVYAPNDVNAAARLAGFATIAGGEQSEKLKAALNDILASGKASATVHLILGTAATREGDLEKARLHLEQANRLSNKSPEILNNLAWVLANSDPPDLESAEQLAAEAVELAPTNSSIRETHGQILAQLDRPQEAVAELEFALRSPDAPNRREIHETLADMYQKLGDDALAEAHTRRAEQEPATNQESIIEQNPATELGPVVEEGLQKPPSPAQGPASESEPATETEPAPAATGDSP